MKHTKDDCDRVQGSFAWALAKLDEGLPVRRKSWPRDKYVSNRGPNGSFAVNNDIIGSYAALPPVDQEASDWAVA